VSGAESWDAHLDPWCLVPLTDGETILFGFALVHPSTGGLAWLTTSEVLQLDEAAGRAKTRSGRRYRLGRRFNPLDVGAEGEEARATFELLVGEEFDGNDKLQNVDRMWLTACKAARHLRMVSPPRRGADVYPFLQQHAAAYEAVLKRKRRP
jgi:hypothetical protein